MKRKCVILIQVTVFLLLNIFCCNIVNVLADNTGKAEQKTMNYPRNPEQILLDSMQKQESNNKTPVWNKVKTIQVSELDINVDLAGYQTALYRGLDKKSSRNIYNKILTCLYDISSEVIVENSTVNEVTNIINRVIVDNPKIYYIDSADTYENINGDIRGVVRYIDSRETLLDERETVEEIVEKIIESNIKEDMSDFEKVLTLTSYVVENSNYDFEWYYKNSPKKSLIDLLISGKGVCHDYAVTMKLLLDEVGVDCLYISSNPMNHAWNLVKIAPNGQSGSEKVWYHLDATWMDYTPGYPAESTNG